MQTKLSRYCEGIIEAAWLAAVMLIPIFFNIYSNRIFEPDKITLLRTLALLTLAAWIVKLIDQGGIRWDNLHPEGSKFRALLKIPLVTPVAVLAGMYLISTIFSVSPATSFWGSYQRLQGTYTTFSYLVIFAAIAANLRSRPQVERLFTTIIISSVPVGLYGVLQRYGLDPIPWGGNVASRIAANMGNSIFVAAYLIMAFPPTIVRIIDAFDSILKGRGSLWPNFARATTYVFIAAIQLIAIYFSGSRGPWIGWGVSLIFMGLALSLIWRKRWLTAAGLGLGILALVFLIVLNIPDGPLQSLRERPGVGRLGQIFDTESRTGQVRSLIWQGASELAKPHAPLEFPDGRKDLFNFLRPLIGYGPESMYVAFNRFYPPELTQVEMRNASPDRAHNETWDSIVMTGVLGLGVYLVLFGSLFYYGLKWLGLVNDRRQRLLLIGLYAGGGVLSAIAAVIWKGLGYLGVGLPLGMIGGVILYLILVALFGQYQAPQTRGEMRRALTLTALLGMLAAHFVEINFGIAIAATRTYFWTSSALLLVVGYILPMCGEYEMSFFQTASVPATASEARQGQVADSRPAQPISSSQAGKRGQGGPGKGGDRSGTGTRKKARSNKYAPQTSRKIPEWLHSAMAGSLLLAILVATLGYNYVVISQGGNSAFAVIWNSLTRLESGGSISLGIFSLVAFTWLAAGIILSAETLQENERLPWGKLLGATLGVSLGIGLIFWLWHAASLRSAGSLTTKTMEDILALVGRYEGHLTRYYIFLFLALLGLAFYLPQPVQGKLRESKGLSLVLAPVLLLLVVVLAAYTNLRIIQADIAFKLAEPFARSPSWPVSIRVYQRAIDLAPSEDYYYLFLGRAYFEQAKTITDANQRIQLVSQAEQDLKKAQDINPLNTDHTANLARLYSLWSLFARTTEEFQEKRELSNEYFEKTMSLSPNNSKLWGEWAMLYLSQYNEPQEAYERISHALELDPTFDYLHQVMGEYYNLFGISTEDAGEKAEAFKQASLHFEEANRLASAGSGQAAEDLKKSQVYDLLAQAYASIDSGRPEEAIPPLAEAVRLMSESSDVWRYEKLLAELYVQVGEKTQALEHAQKSLAGAPDAEKDSIQNLVNQIQAMQ